MHPTILVPVYNDWDAVARLLGQLDATLSSSSRQAEVLLVDDASTDPMSRSLFEQRWGAFTDLKVLRLRGNLGHQRAIAVGLAYIESESTVPAVVVMDGDGEDKAEDVPRLLDCFESEGARKLVFALRLRRSEGIVFASFYHLYRLVHWLLTGIPVRFGNFSVIPREAISTLVVSADLWNHYAASVLKARLPFAVIPADRGRRLSGESRMSFVAQVSHGLSALSVFGELVGVRLLIASFFLSAAFLFFVIAVTLVALGSEMHLPGWAAYTAGLLLVLLMQTLLGSVGATLLVLHGRGRSGFLPLRDYRFFVAGVEARGER